LRTLGVIGLNPKNASQNRPDALKTALRAAGKFAEQLPPAFKRAVWPNLSEKW
jgi:hypothetical protein